MLRQFPREAPRQDACVGDDVVESAELLDAIGDQLLLKGEVARITLAGKDFAADFLDEPYGLGEVGLCRRRVGDVVGNGVGDVETDDRCALTRKTDGVVATLTARDTRDVDDCAVELSHRQNCNTF